MTCFKNYSSQWRFNGSGSMLQSSLKYGQEVKGVTVEFWFRRIQPTLRDNYLMQLFNPDSQAEVLSVQQVGRKLACAVQPSSSLVIDHYSVNSTSWTFIACRVAFGFDVSTVFYQSSVQFNTTSLPRQWGRLSGDYTFNLGNNQWRTMGQASGTFFKEVRMWLRPRTIDEIYSGIFTQVQASQSGLALYFKMTSGGPEIANYASLGEAQAATRWGLVQDSDFALSAASNVCPPGSFRGEDQRCYQSPFTSHELQVFPVLEGNQVAFYFTSYYSEVLVPYSARSSVFKDSLYSTIIGNQTIPSSSGRLSTQVNSTFNISQAASSLDTTWFSRSSLTVRTLSCAYFLPINQTKAETDFHLTESPGSRDITLGFTFFNNCVNASPAFNQSRSTFKVLGGKVSVTWAFDRLAGLYQVTLASEDLSKIPLYESVIVLGRLQFGADEDQTFQNIAFNIKYIETFTPVISGQSIVLRGESMLLYGSQSRGSAIAYGLPQAGLNYYWTCPTELLSLCSTQQNTLDIDHASFIKLGGEYDKDYRFGLQVYRGIDVDVNLSHIPVLFVIVRWVRTSRPDFLLVAPAPQAILASTPFSLRAAMRNYDVSDPDLDITWSISPDNQVKPDFINRSSRGDVLSVNQGALAFNQTYLVNVTAVNTKYAEATQSQTLVLQTYPQGPVNGTVQYDPGNAVAMSSINRLSLANWTTANKGDNITFTVDLVLQSGTTVQLTQTPLEQTSPFLFMLPNGAQQLIVKIYTNSTPEYTQYLITPQVIASADNSQLEPYLLYDNLELQSKETLLQKLGNFTIALSHVIESGQWNQTAVMRVIKAIEEVQNFSLGDRDTQASVLAALGVISKSQNITKEAYQSVKAQLAHLVKSQSLFQVTAEESQVTERMLQVLSNLWQYSINLPTSMRRLLQSNITFNAKDELRELFNIKDTMALAFCRSNQGVANLQYAFSSPQLALTLMYASDFSLIDQRRFFSERNMSTFSSYPLGMRNETQLCVVQTEIKNSSAYRMTFPSENQTVSPQSPILQIQQLPMNPSNSTESLTVGVQFSYLYNISTWQGQKESFKHNQTVIESLANPLHNQQWSDQQCTTRYLVNASLIAANCSVIATNGSLNLFFAVVTDTNRKLIEDYTTPWYLQFLEDALNFDESVLPVLIFIIATFLTLPVIATLLDKLSYSAIVQGRDEQDGLTLDFIRQVAAKKGVPYEFILYHTSHLRDYYELKSVTWCSLFCLFMKHLMPLGSLFRRFDMEYKRLSRFIVIQFQITFIAIIASVVFSVQGYRNLRQEDSEGEAKRDADGMDLTDLINAIVVGVILSVLTLPPWQWLIACFKSQLQIEKVVQPDPVKEIEDNQLEGGNSEDANFEDQPHKSEHDVNLTQDAGFNDSHLEESRRLKGSYHSRNSSAAPQLPSYENEIKVDRELGMIVSQKSNVLCKLFLMLLCLIATLAALLAVGFSSSKAPRGNSEALALSFFIAVLFGHIILNTIRVMLNAHYAPKIAQALEEEGPGCMVHLTNFLIVSPDALKMLDDMLIVYEVKQSRKVQSEQLTSSKPTLQLDNGPSHISHNQRHSEIDADASFEVSRSQRQNGKGASEAINLDYTYEEQREVTDFNSRTEEKLSPQVKPYDLEEISPEDRQVGQFRDHEDIDIGLRSNHKKHNVPPLLFSALPPSKIDNYYRNEDQLIDGSGLTDRMRAGSHNRMSGGGNTTRIHDSELDHSNMVSKRAFKEDFDTSARGMQDLSAREGSPDAKKTSRRQQRRDRYQANVLKDDAPRAKQQSDDDMDDIGITPRREDPLEQRHHHLNLKDVQQVEFEVLHMDSSNKSVAIILDSNSSQHNQHQFKDSHNSQRLKGAGEYARRDLEIEVPDNYQDFM